MVDTITPENKMISLYELTTREETLKKNKKQVDVIEIEGQLQMYEVLSKKKGERCAFRIVSTFPVKQEDLRTITRSRYTVPVKLTLRVLKDIEQ